MLKVWSTVCCLSVWEFYFDLKKRARLCCRLLIEASFQEKDDLN